VKDKETEKIDKYQELCLEIQQLWNMRTIVIPMVVGALGVVSTAFNHHTSRLIHNTISTEGDFVGDSKNFETNTSALWLWLSPNCCSNSFIPVYLQCYL